MDIDTYLDRIGYMGSRAPTAGTLRELQLAHLIAVPFENLSIPAGEPIVLGDEPLFEKIVGRRRGGFCYELNGLFSALLRSLGFRVAKLSARVARGDGVFSEEFDHMTLLVWLEERWLADVGFGDTFREPLRIDETAAQLQDRGAYRIETAGDRRVMSERGADGGWEAQYSFSLEPHEYADYAARCHYQQTSPQSNFTGRRLCTRATPDGRLTLSDMRLISTTLAGDRQERMLKSEAEVAQILRKEFGIVMGRPLNPAGQTNAW